MKRRMIPRERPPPKPMDKKTAEELVLRQRHASEEMMGKQHQQMVDGIRTRGKKSTNMLVRVAMMAENPVFAAPDETLPSSMRNTSYPSARDTSSQEDLVKGGTGENLYLVSRGVAPSVVPGKYGGNHQSVMKSTYADHWSGSDKNFTKNITATHAGAAQAKYWAEAARTKKELEAELGRVNDAIGREGSEVQQSATSHGLFGRIPPGSEFDGRNTVSSQNKLLTAPKGLTVMRGTTMSDSFVEHPLRRTKKWGVSIFDHSDPATQMAALPPPKDGSIKTISLNGIQRRIPNHPSELTTKRGSHVLGSAYQWKDTHQRSSKSEDFSLPSAKLTEVDPDTEKPSYTHKYNAYDITKTRYGESARECDLVRGSVYVVPKDVMEAEKAKRMRE